MLGSFFIPNFEIKEIREIEIVAVSRKCYQGSVN